MRHLTQSTRVVRAATSAVMLGVTACGDGTGPRGTKLPGQRLLGVDQFAAWVWVPGKAEIIFSTPFDYPYTGPPTRLDAVSVPGGSRRTVVAAPTNGDEIIGRRFSVVGSHLYYYVRRPGSDAVAYYRAPLDGTSPPAKILDAAPLTIAVSPDERTAAWAESDQAVLRWRLVTMDIASGAQRTYPLQREGGNLTWSPSSRSVVVDAGGWSSTGTPLQWVDVSTGNVKVWFDREPYSDVVPTRDFAWDGESPTAYVVGAGVARYPLATGAREFLATFAGSGAAVGWSADFTTVTIQTTAQCSKTSTGILGETCAHWSGSVDRLAWKSGARTAILQYGGSVRPEIFARAAPDGLWIAYENRSCGRCDGLYAVSSR